MLPYLTPGYPNSHMPFLANNRHHTQLSVSENIEDLGGNGESELQVLLWPLISPPHIWLISFQQCPDRMLTLQVVALAYNHMFGGGIASLIAPGFNQVSSHSSMQPGCFSTMGGVG